MGAQLGVEIGERLVHQKGRRRPHERPGKCHALALAARKLCRLTVEKMGDLQRFGSLADADVDLLERGGGCRHPADQRHASGERQIAHAKRGGDVLTHRHVRIERVRLEDHGEVAVARVHLGNIVVSDQHATPVWPFEARDDPQKR